jgi:putative ABC transport system substrate-binding protein
VIRRLLVAASLAFGAVVAVYDVHGQPATKVARIGYLGGGSWGPVHEAFRQGLRDLGWVDGQNVRIDYRFADGRFDRLPGLATELLRLNIDVLVATPSVAAVAASRATANVPIVIVNVGDPIGLGLVASLARPRGNVTGTTFSVGLESFGKALELLKATIPNLRTVAVLINPANPGQLLAIKDLKAAAHTLDVTPLFFEARVPEDFERVFARIAKERAEAMLVVTDPLFVVNRAKLGQLALENRVPSMYGAAENLEAGGLMSFGPSLAEGSRRAAVFVDKILKGARPADLPIEQPTKFELVVNLGTAKALGVTIPQSVLLRADKVIR